MQTDSTNWLACLEKNRNWKPEMFYLIQPHSTWPLAVLVVGLHPFVQRLRPANMATVVPISKIPGYVWKVAL